MHDDERGEIDRYVRRLIWALQPLPQADRLNIGSEIHSHLTECAGRGDARLDAALVRLGPADRLAQRYVEDHELSGAVNRAAPARLLVAMLGRATSNLIAFASGCGASILYLFALGFAANALLKPFMPDQVGYWTQSGRFVGFGIGVVGAQTQAVERLGYAIIPLCAVAAILCYVAGTRLLKGVAHRLLTRGDLPA